ncbi:MAG: hypothetical protein KC910_24515 [Candidatus Eremiobacteraeota bacterium]|nr:hypothetical protein [Candidatus Eremiobacteraeota bacterium]
MLEHYALDWLETDLSEPDRARIDELLRAVEETDQLVVEFEGGVAAALARDEETEVPLSVVLSGMRHYQRSQLARMRLFQHLGALGQKQISARLGAIEEYLEEATSS